MVAVKSTVRSGPQRLSGYNSLQCSYRTTCYWLTVRIVSRACCRGIYSHRPVNLKALKATWATHTYKRENLAIVRSCIRSTGYFRLKYTVFYILLTATPYFDIVNVIDVFPEPIKERNQLEPLLLVRINALLEQE